MPRELMVGVDLGSGACKTYIVDPEGHVLGRASEEYPTYYPQPRWAEQDPRDWYKAFTRTLGEALTQAAVSGEDIASVCVGSVTHNAVLLDDCHELLRPTILHTDARSTSQVARAKADIGPFVYSVCLNDITPAWTLPQLMWIKENEPDVFRRIHTIMFPKDYVKFKLTGVISTDWIDPLGTLMYSPTTRSWSEEICSYVGIDPGVFPPIVEPTSIVGQVTAKAAKDTGLAEGTPVVCGAPDTANEVFGSGAIRRGQCTVKLATIGRICVVSPVPCLNPLILNYCFIIPGTWYPGTGTKSCASSIRWVRDVFCTEEIRTAKTLGINVYEMMDQMAERVPAGAEGLLFHPYLIGEMCPVDDPYLRADFVGMTMRHRKEHFIRAAFEGVSYSLRHCLELVRSLGIPISELRLIGGGTKSHIWKRILCDVLGEELVEPHEVEAAFGTALLGGIGVGIFKSPEEAAERCVRLRAHLTPDVGNHELYSELFAVYKRVAQDLSEANRMLHAVVNRNS